MLITRKKNARLVWKKNKKLKGISRKLSKRGICPGLMKRRGENL